jgi:non-specific serine/threonine protein kinase
MRSILAHVDHRSGHRPSPRKARSYAARDEELDRSVAVKVIAEELADEAAMRRFRREARAAAAVDHPNVCQLYEIGEHQGALYVAMELLEGSPSRSA